MARKKGSKNKEKKETKGLIINLGKTKTFNINIKSGVQSTNITIHDNINKLSIVQIRNRIVKLFK